jgi:hypothetical protein
MMDSYVGLVEAAGWAQAVRKVLAMASVARRAEILRTVVSLDSKDILDFQLHHSRFALSPDKQSFNSGSMACKHFVNNLEAISIIMGGGVFPAEKHPNTSFSR